MADPGFSARLLYSNPRMLQSDPTAFFVYGTLMQGQENFAACAADELTVTPATAAGTLYHLRAGFPIAVDTQAGRITGQIMTFPDPARTLAVFDELEGVAPRHPDRSLYVRVVREAQPLHAPDPVRCWMYLAPPDRLPRIRPYATLVPGGDWAAFLEAGACV